MIGAPPHLSLITDQAVHDNLRLLWDLLGAAQADLTACETQFSALADLSTDARRLQVRQRQTEALVMSGIGGIGGATRQLLAPLALGDDLEGGGSFIADPHHLLSLTHSDTLIDSAGRGALIVGNATPLWARLNRGAAGTYLRSDGVDLSWQTIPVAELTGVLPVASGGTGLSSLTSPRVLYVSAADTIGTSADFAFDQPAGIFTVNAIPDNWMGMALLDTGASGFTYLIFGRDIATKFMTVEAYNDTFGDNANYLKGNLQGIIRTGSGFTTGMRFIAQAGNIEFVVGGFAFTDRRLVLDEDALELASGAASMELRIREPSGGGTSYTGFAAPALAGNIIYTLPIADGGAGEFLSTDGGGVLSWGAAAGANHDLLSGTHSDTLAAAVSRGSIVYGNATPDWAEFVVGTGVLHADGTDVTGWSLVDLAADVTNDLPFANLVQASAASRIVGRGSAAGAGDFEEITIGANLTMTGTTLSADAGPHAILDGSVHTDSVADGVTRGSLITGNSTPKWDELVIGAANAVLSSDGTDISWATDVPRISGVPVNNQVPVWTGAGTIEGDANLTWSGSELFIKASGSHMAFDTTAANQNAWWVFKDNGVAKFEINKNTANDFNIHSYPFGNSALYCRLASVIWGIGEDINFPAAGTKGLIFGDGTALSSMGTNTGGLYANDVAGTVEMFAIDEADNAAQLTPHNFTLFTPDPAEPYPWDYYSYNRYLGIEIGVDLTKLVRLVEGLTGERLIHTRQLPANERLDWVDTQRTNTTKGRQHYEAWEQGKERHKPDVPIVKRPPSWMLSRLRDLGRWDESEFGLEHAKVEQWKDEKPGRRP